MAAVCRECGVSQAIYYNWKAKYGGMEVSDIKKLKDLEAENKKLKQMYANLSLEHEVLKDIIEKKLKAAEKRELVDYAREAFSLSICACCRLLDFSRSVYQYRPVPNRDQEVIEKLSKLVERYPRYGFPKLFAVLRREGFNWNHKWVHRVYCKMGLNMRRKGKQRLLSRNPQSLSVPATMNQSWSMDL